MNVLGIVGLGVACRLCIEVMDSERDQLTALRERLRKRICEALPETRVNGHPQKRLPGHLNLSISGVDKNALLERLVSRGALSLGSACTSAIPQPSHILKAIQLPQELLYSTFRIGLGRFSEQGQIDRAADEFLAAVWQLSRSADCKRRAEVPGFPFVG